MLVSYFIFKRYYVSEKLPNFSYTQINGQVFKEKDIKRDKKTLFLYFDCACDECSETISKLLDNSEIIHTYQVILVSSASQTEVLQECIDLKKANDNGFLVLIDDKNNFPSDFGLGIMIEYPTVIIFDENHHRLNKEHTTKLLNSI